MSFFQETGLCKQEIKAGSELLIAFEEARNRDTVRKGARQLLASDHGQYLYAVNRFSRIKWGKALCAEFADFFDLTPEQPYPNQPLFWVTLVDLGCSTAHDAEILNVEPFQRQLRVGLKGLSYVGMIEPAYYVNISKAALYTGKRGVFWHLHAVCWGECKDAMKERFVELNKMPNNYRPIADGLLGAHYRRIPRTLLADKPRTHLADKFRYMLKFPRKAYRIYKSEFVTPDGEILSHFKQKQDDLRPGQRITMFHLLKHLYLDGMAIAGGEGVSILRQTKRQALRDLRK